MEFASEVDDHGRFLAPSVDRMGAGRFLYDNTQIVAFLKNHTTDSIR